MYWNGRACTGGIVLTTAGRVAQGMHLLEQTMTLMLKGMEFSPRSLYYYNQAWGSTAGMTECLGKD